MSYFAFEMEITVLEPGGVERNWTDVERNWNAKKNKLASKPHKQFTSQNKRATGWLCGVCQICWEQEEHSSWMLDVVLSIVYRPNGEFGIKVIWNESGFNVKTLFYLNVL